MASYMLQNTLQEISNKTLDMTNENNTIIRTYNPDTYIATYIARLHRPPTSQHNSIPVEYNIPS